LLHRRSDQQQEPQVLKKVLMCALVLGALVFGAKTDTAQAAIVAAPQSVRLAAETLAPIDVRWVCTASRCTWRPGYVGPMHPWAVWGPPRRPGCYYVKRNGRWFEVCR
jgi:hypothetical protein